MKLQKLTKIGATAGGLIGLIFGGVAFYMQPGDEDETKPVESVSSVGSADTAKTKIIDVVSNADMEEKA